MRFIRFAAFAPLFFASSAFAFGDMNQPGVGPGTLVSVSSLTATDCIKTDSSGTQFQANCDNGQDVVVGASGLSVGGQSIVNGSSTVKGASSLLGTITLQNGETIANSTNGEILQTGDSVVSGQAIIKGSTTIDSSSGLSVSGCIKTDADGVEFNANCTAGMVGIGNASPGTKLHVSSGVILADGTAPAIIADTNNAAYGLANGLVARGKFPMLQLVNNQGTGNYLSWALVCNDAVTGMCILKQATTATGDPSAGLAVMNFGLDRKILIADNKLYGAKSQLEVDGDFMFGAGATKSTGTATGDMYVVGALRPAVKTKAQIHAITPALGDVYVCSDCTNSYTLCVGTGTAINDFREVGTATGCTP